MACVTISLAMAGSRVSITGGIYAYVEAAFGPFVGLPRRRAAVAHVSCSRFRASRAPCSTSSRSSSPASRRGCAHVGVLAAAPGRARVAECPRRPRRNTPRRRDHGRQARAAARVHVRGRVLRGSVRDRLARHAVRSMRIGRSVLLLIFAYAGVEVALAPSGEVRNPSRTVPRAVFFALRRTTALYIAIQLVAQGVSGPALGAADGCAARRCGGPVPRARRRHADARRRRLLDVRLPVRRHAEHAADPVCARPRRFSADGVRAHPPGDRTRRRSPSGRHAALVLAFASTNTFQSLAIIGNVALLILYVAGVRRRRWSSPAATCGSTARRSRPPAPGLARRLEGRPAAVWILSTATAPEFAVTAVVLAVAAVVPAPSAGSGRCATRLASAGLAGRFRGPPRAQGRR